MNECDFVEKSNFSCQEPCWRINNYRVFSGQLYRLTLFPHVESRWGTSESGLFHFQDWDSMPLLL
jgi:hypothetical protein